VSPLTIFEGPDCSGKSTVAHAFFQKAGTSGVTWVHHGPYPQLKRTLPRLYVETMLPMLMNGLGQIWDRCWLSEPIYGHVFRHGEDRVGPVNARHLERFAFRHGAVVVLCLPPYEAVLEKWRERKGEEYLDSEEQLLRVYNLYQGLPKLTSLPVVLYDYTRHSPEALYGAVEKSRTTVHPMWHVHAGGNMQAKIVLVGDKFSELKDEDCNWRLPFASFSAQGSASWLTQGLIDYKIPERELLWVNADDDLTWLAHRHNEHVVALGHKAAHALEKCNVAHVEVSHPQYHKRFQSGQTYELLELLASYLGPETN
jgi:thymidylate kinase